MKAEHRPEDGQVDLVRDGGEYPVCTSGGVAERASERGIWDQAHTDLVRNEDDVEVAMPKRHRKSIDLDENVRRLRAGNEQVRDPESQAVHNCDVESVETLYRVGEVSGRLHGGEVVPPRKAVRGDALAHLVIESLRRRDEGPARSQGASPL